MSSFRAGQHFGLILASAAVIVSLAPQAHARMGGGFSGGSIGRMGGQTTSLAPGRPPRYTPVAPPPAANPYWGHHGRPTLYVPGQYGNTTGLTATGLPK